MYFLCIIIKNNITQNKNYTKNIRFAMELKNSAQRVQDILQQHNLTTKVIEFSQTTRTAQ